MNPSEAKSEHAEAALLANMMLATTIKTEELEGISPGDFIDQRHGLIWSAISSEVRSGSTDAPSLVVVDRLQALGALETAGGFEYVNSFGAWSIGHRLPSAEACVEIIKQGVNLRRPWLPMGTAASLALRWWCSSMPSTDLKRLRKQERRALGMP